MVAPRRSEEFAAVREDMVGEGQMGQGLSQRVRERCYSQSMALCQRRLAAVATLADPFIAPWKGDTMTICVAGVWQCSRAGGEPLVAHAVATWESSPPLDNGAPNSHNNNPVTRAILLYSV